ncbi:hypothetical protein PAPHI01_1303 [Pancytospora philotis]|nr:hypothetical protein PAPHI01_1303 [Pancytospora philotis]
MSDASTSEQSQLVRRKSSESEPEPVPIPEKEKGAKPKLLSWQNIMNVLHKKSRPKNSPLKHFIIMVYLLYLRYTAEFGITAMTYTEVLVFNVICFFTIFSIVNQGSRLIFFACVKLLYFLRCAYWAYTHRDEVKHIVDG